MDDATRPLVGWRDLAGTIPGAVGVQVDDELAYVSPDLATLPGRDDDALTGEPWRTLFDGPETARIEDAIERARTEGEWTGTVALVGVDDAVELTLSSIDDEAVLWVLDGPEPGAEAGEDPATGRARRLWERPAFVREVLDALDDILYVIDEDGESYLWNETLVETTGYSHEAIDEMAPMEFVPPDQHEYVPGLMEAIDATEDRRVRVDVLTKDGERVPHEFRGTTFEDPETGAAFRCGLARDVSDRLDRERELQRYETIVETVRDGVYVLDEELRFTFVNDALCELSEMDRSELLGTTVEELFTYDDERAAAAEIRRRVVENDTSTGTVQATVETADGERTLESRYRLHPEPDGSYRGSVGVIRDVTDREARERTLERQRDDLATLNRINELLLETTRKVIRTASREAVERAVCERLAASELYRFAWVGEPAYDADRLVHRASAGEDDGSSAAVTDTDPGDPEQGPAGRAMATGEVQVADGSDPGFGASRDAREEHGVESVAAVPLQHDGTVYGVLVVHATRGDAFSDRERAGFDVLGRTVGAVIHAAKNRELLFADAIVELEFRVADGDSPYVRTADDLVCELELEGYVSSGERWVLYFAVDGASAGEVVESLAGEQWVERGRVVEGDGAGRLELVVSRSSLLDDVTAAGAIVRAADVDPDGVDLVVEAPVDAEIREVTDRVREAFSGVQLLARRHRDRPVAESGRPAGLLGELTDRQREVLEVAYRAGYFSWPRESTAEEVAASLDVAPPTLHAHLRKAEDAILSGLFERDRGSE